MKPEELENIDVGEEVLYVEKQVVGEIISVPGGKRLNFSSEDIPASEVPDILKPDKLAKFPLCEQRHEKAVYNDRKEKWVCPFCNNE